MGIFNLLEKVERLSGMYLSGGEGERGLQLQNLQFFLYGYGAAVNEHGVSDDVKDFPREFGVYLRARYGWSMSTGAIAAIRRETKSDEDAWATFWRLVWEFRDSLQPTPQRSGPDQPR